MRDRYKELAKKDKTDDRLKIQFEIKPHIDLFQRNSASLEINTIFSSSVLIPLHKEEFFLTYAQKTRWIVGEQFYCYFGIMLHYIWCFFQDKSLTFPLFSLNSLGNKNTANFSGLTKNYIKILTANQSGLLEYALRWTSHKNQKNREKN